jgi:hypothetical protein
MLFSTIKFDPENAIGLFHVRGMKERAATGQPGSFNLTMKKARRRKSIRRRALRIKKPKTLDALMKP